MGMREKLIEILSVPIYPHELVDPIEAVADYLIDSGVTIPVRCKDCVNYCGFEHCKNGICDVDSVSKRAVHPNDFCSYGERRTDD